MLLFLIVMRMTGFIFLNPILGRRSIPNLAKAGLVMVLSVMVYSTMQAQGYTDSMEVDSSLVFGVLLLKEFAVGFVLGFVMQLFDMAVTFAGSLIDFQMGISMATIYDPQSGTQVALTGNILQIFYLLLFFAVDGHLVLMRILVTSGDIVPYGAAALGAGAVQAVLDIFIQCVVIAVKLAFPLIAFEFIVEIGIGILMKITPQVNLFVLSIQLRLLVGVVLLVFLVSPIGSYLGNVITEMMNTLGDVLKLTAG